MNSLKSYAAGAALAVVSFVALASEVTFFDNPPSTRTRAEVVAELRQARASGELASIVGLGEATPFREAIAAAARSRDDVRVARNAAAGAKP
jgi:hypothetical protein